MPVRKFRTMEEMNAADEDRWLDCDDPTLADRIRKFWAMWERMVPLTDIPRGVHKYRSIEEMNAHRERWERARIERLRK